MTDKLKGIITAVAAAAALTVGGAAIAGASGNDPQPAAEPVEASLAHVGGGEVTDTEVGDEEGFYEVEVTTASGEVDVHLDEQFDVLGTEGDSREDRNGR